MVGVAAVLAAVAVVLAIWLVPPRYTAKAEILVDATGPFSATQDPASQQRLDAAAILTEVTELKSGGLVRQVVRKLRSDPAFAAPAAVVRAHPAAAMPEGTVAAVLRRATAILHSAHDAVTGPPALPTFHSFTHDLRVFQEAGSHVVAVTFTSTSPERAALAVNTLVQMHLQQEQRHAQQATARALAWVDQQIPVTRRAVQSLRDQAHHYGDSNDLPTFGDSGVIRDEVAQLSRELVTSEADLAAKTDHLKQMKNARGEGVAPPDAPGLSELRAREAALLQSSASARFSLSAASPLRQRIDSQLHAVRRAIAARVAGAHEAFAQDVTAETAKVALIRKRLHDLQGEANQPRLRNLEQAIAFQSGLMDSLLKRREVLREQGASYTAGVQMLSLAVPPERPSSVSPILFLPPAVILAGVCATVLGLLRDSADTTVRTGRELYESLGVPCIGTVPKVRPRRRRPLHELLVDQPYCMYAEAIRFAAAGLGIVRAHGPPVVILVTSAVPREGKTTFAASLATMAASMGKRTVLVDLDLRHPSVQREIGPGAAARKCGGATWAPMEDGTRAVPDLHLDLVASRRNSTNALRLFAGEEMPNQIAQLRYRYDCVIIDSAPLLAMAEVRLIARLADQVVLAVKWNSTRTDMVQNALNLLHAPGQLTTRPLRNVFAVITQVDLRKHARQCAGDHAEIAMRYSSYYKAIAR